MKVKIGSVIFCLLFVYVMCAMAAPATEEVVLDPELTAIDVLKHKHKATKLEKKASREDRQFAYEYPSYAYDFYNYPAPYYNQYTYYPSYQQPQAYYPYPQPPPPAPTKTPSRTTPHRRGYRPIDRIEATSQKYTVWDLARK